MLQPLRTEQGSDLTRAIDALVTAEGAAAHPYVLSRKLVEGRDATRNLADTVHFFGLLHGRQPGLMDHAAARAVQAEERHW
ncbi:MAG: hypothetical protein K2X31_10965, partial [Sphingopyxis sp.]|nr:hypothetical protein [Sphingopyxis sp.]